MFIKIFSIFFLVIDFYFNFWEEGHMIVAAIAEIKL